jgi:serine/threonine protein kinase
MTTRLREKSRQNHEAFHKRYDIIGKIGEGAYGIVRLVRDRQTGEQVAMKTFKLKLTREGEGIPITVCREINLLRELDHENILKVRDVVLETGEKSLSMILNYCKLDIEVSKSLIYIHY